MTAPAAPVPSAWQNRIVGTGVVNPADLLANPRNWRKHPDSQKAALATVLDRIGWVQNVIVNRRTGLLVDGHLRVELAVQRGATEIPVVYVDLSPEEEALVLATIDPIGAFADTDADLLRELLEGPAARPDDPEASALLASIAAEFGIVAEKAPSAEPPGPGAPPADPITRPGDLILLGKHRLYCGDARKAESYDALCRDLGEADCVWTDPPYGVDYVGKTSEALTIENDAKDIKALRTLLDEALGQALANCRPGAAWYVASPQMEQFDVFAAVLNDLGLRRHTLIWVKDAFVLGRSDYHYRHEPIFYGWKEGAAHYFVDDRTQDSVWEIPRPKASEDHPTMKPVELVARALRNSTRPGELVLDPFGGSGTTLLAAEQEGRRAALIELDPRYVDVIVRRWEEMTGQTAVRPAR